MVRFYDFINQSSAIPYLKYFIFSVDVLSTFLLASKPLQNESALKEVEQILIPMETG